LVTAVPCLGSSLADAQHLPQGRRQAGDRHLKFHETRDNQQPGDVSESFAGVRVDASPEIVELRELLVDLVAHLLLDVSGLDRVDDETRPSQGESREK